MRNSYSIVGRIGFGVSCTILSQISCSICMDFGLWTKTTLKSRWPIGSPNLDQIICTGSPNQAVVIGRGSA